MTRIVVVCCTASPACAVHCRINVCVPGVVDAFVPICVVPSLPPAICAVLVPTCWVIWQGAEELMPTLDHDIVMGLPLATRVGCAIRTATALGGVGVGVRGGSGVGIGGNCVGGW